MIKLFTKKQVTEVKPISSSPPKQLNSNEAFRYLKYSWRIIGMSPPRRFRILYYGYSLLVIIFSAILLPLSLMTNLYFLDNLQTVLANLSVSLTFLMATLKQLTVFIYYNNLKKAERFLTPLDVRCDQHPIDRQCIRSSIKLSRIIYTSYMAFYFCTAYSMVIGGYSQHQLVQNGWFPQLVDDPQTNYLLAFSYQTAAQTITIVQNAFNDMYHQCYIVMLTGHLRALATRITRIGMDASRSVHENQEELLNCIQDHKNIQSYFVNISKVISITIFLQFLITAFILCLTAINMMLFQTKFAAIIVTIMYLILVLAEVFPVCLLANLMMDETNKLTTAMYSCNWYNQDQKFRKTLIIFMQRSQLSNVIMAGNMASVSLQTFVSIIKFSFSMFTVLSKINID